MNSFQGWGLSYAFGGESAEYVFSFMKLCDINIQYVLIRFRHNRHVTDSFFTPRLSDNIFHKPYIRRSYIHFSQVQVTLPYSRRKIKMGKMVCMPMIGVRVQFLVH
jgi:hypothetical protein